MKLIDRYILKKFLSTFLFVVGIFVVIIVIIDMTEKMEDFIKTSATKWQIFYVYYLNFIPHITNQLSPVLVFIAVVFVTAKLASRTEIVAILSSGVSFRRFLLPYLIGAAGIGVAIFILIGWIVPNANKSRLSFESEFLRNKYYFNETNVHIQLTPNLYAYMHRYNNSSNIGHRFTLERIENNELKEKLESYSIKWDSTKHKWHINSYKIRTFDGLKEHIITGENMDTTLNINPKDFEDKHLYYERLTMGELNNYIALLKNRGSENVIQFIVEKYIRYTYPLTVVILTLIGVIVSAKKSRQGVGFQIAIGFVLAFLYILFFIMIRAVAEAGTIPPLLAVWMPNLLFSIIGLVLYKTVPK